jgi:sugar phosphate isomerase/epimerase
MIYISSSCVKNKFIKDSVLELVRAGFRDIELSGGTELYSELENDLLELKDNFNLNYLCHNYFPPPKEHFVLNLASLDEKVHNDSISHLLKSIKLSKNLGAEKFAFHAGFFLDINVSEIGRAITLSDTYDYDKSINRFCNAYKIVKKEAGDLKLYIENNVYSFQNHKTFGGKKAFMLTNSEEYFQLKSEIDFNLLLDIAHLKVSANSHGLDYFAELNTLINETDYIHLSDNDSLSDENKCLYDNNILDIIKSNLNKTYTMETYSNMSNIQENHKFLNEKLN